MGFGILTISC